MNALKEKIIDDEDLQKGDFHQAILNHADNKWEVEDSWTYYDMIKWVGEEYGDLAQFAVLIGELNDQVCNGGFLQYFESGYASVPTNDKWDGRDHHSNKNVLLHKRMLKLFTKLDLNKTELGSTVFMILSSFKIVIDLDSTRTVMSDCLKCGGLGDDCFDCDGTGRMKCQIENESYEEVINTDKLKRLDDRYYKINEAWMKFLNTYFKGKEHG